MNIKSEPVVTYTAQKTIKPLSDDELIDRALTILNSRIRTTPVLTCPDDVRSYIRLQLATSEREIFACLFLDNRHRVIAFDKLFFGTIDGASVHPREVAKAALQHNAAAIILCHNHPSGTSEPSQADQTITRKLVDALALLDIRVLDHLIVGNDITSFAEQGLL